MHLPWSHPRIMDLGNIKRTLCHLLQTWIRRPHGTSDCIMWTDIAASLATPEAQKDMLSIVIQMQDSIMTSIYLIVLILLQDLK